MGDDEKQPTKAGLQNQREGVVERPDADVASLQVPALLGGRLVAHGLRVDAHLLTVDGKRPIINISSRNRGNTRCASLLHSNVQYCTCFWSRLVCQGKLEAEGGP